MGKTFGLTVGIGSFLILAVAFLVTLTASGCGDDGVSQEEAATIAAEAAASAVAADDAEEAASVQEVKENLLTELNQKIATATGEVKAQLEERRQEIEAMTAEAVAAAQTFIVAEINRIMFVQADDSTDEEESNSDDDKPASNGEEEHIAKGEMPSFTSESKQGAWVIKGTERLPENPVVAGWLSRLKDPAPSSWKTFPNIPNPDVPEFRVVNGSEVPDGMEYGTYSSPYCYSHPCDIPVGAWEYRYISGDYQFLNTSCAGDGKKGCMLVLVNVMDASYTWRSQDVDNGFTVRGRYFNGDALEWGVWGLVSHGAANMLNMPTLAHPGEVLNAGDPGNSGANCGNPQGCATVDVLVVVHSGDAIIATAHTVVTRP